MKAQEYYVRPHRLNFLRDSVDSPRWVFKLVKVWVGPDIMFISGAYPKGSGLTAFLLTLNGFELVQKQLIVVLSSSRQPIMKTLFVILFEF